MKIGVFISDSAAEYCAKRMANEGFEVITDTERIISLSDDFDAIALPSRGIDAQGYASLIDDRINLKDFISKIPKSAKLFASFIPARSKAIDIPINIALQDARAREKYADLTAEGILYMLIDVTEKSLREHNYCVIGESVFADKIGKILSALKLDVTLIKPSEVESYDASAADIIINADPEKGDLTKSLKDKLDKSLDIIVIDIASNPSISAMIIERSGNIKRIEAPFLPTLAAPQSAADVFADFILKNLK